MAWFIFNERSRSRRGLSSRHFAVVERKRVHSFSNYSDGFRYLQETLPNGERVEEYVDGSHVASYVCEGRLRQTARSVAAYELIRLRLGFVHPAMTGHPELDFHWNGNDYCILNRNSVRGSSSAVLRLSMLNHGYISIRDYLAANNAHASVYEWLGISTSRTGEHAPDWIGPFSTNESPVVPVTTAAIPGYVIDWTWQSDVQRNSHAEISQAEPDRMYDYAPDAQVPDDIWLSEETFEGLVRIGDAIRNPAIDGHEAVCVIEEGRRFSGIVRRLSPSYRIRMQGERVHLHDIVIKHSSYACDLATVITKECDIGKRADVYALVLTRSGLCTPRNYRLHSSGFHIVGPVQAMAGDRRLLNGELVESTSEPDTSNGPYYASNGPYYVRPIGYGAPLEAMPDPELIELPVGYARVSDDRLSPDKDYSLWCGWHEGFVDVSCHVNSIHPQMRPYVFEKVAFNDIRYSLVCNDVSNVRYVGPVKTRPGYMEVGRVCRLILSTAGMMPCFGTLRDDANSGIHFYTSIGRFYPHLFVINGRDSVIFVSSNISENEFVECVKDGLNMMLGHAAHYLGMVTVPRSNFQSTNQYTHRRKVQL